MNSESQTSLTTRGAIATGGNLIVLNPAQQQRAIDASSLPTIDVTPQPACQNESADD
jgi:hypothetical protein